MDEVKKAPKPAGVVLASPSAQRTKAEQRAHHIAEATDDDPPTVTWD